MDYTKQQPHGKTLFRVEFYHKRSGPFIFSSPKSRRDQPQSTQRPLRLIRVTTQKFTIAFRSPGIEGPLFPRGLSRDLAVLTSACSATSAVEFFPRVWKRT